MPPPPDTDLDWEAFRRTKVYFPSADIKRCLADAVFHALSETQTITAYHKGMAYIIDPARILKTITKRRLPRG